MIATAQKRCNAAFALKIPKKGVISITIRRYVSSRSPIFEAPQVYGAPSNSVRRESVPKETLSPCPCRYARPRAFANAACIMIGEKASDLVLAAAA